MPAEWWDKVYVRGHYEKFIIRKKSSIKKNKVYG
jgi:hypothetical protein